MKILIALAVFSASFCFGGEGQVTEDEAQEARRMARWPAHEPDKREAFFKAVSGCWRPESGVVKDGVYREENLFYAIHDEQAMARKVGIMESVVFVYAANLGGSGAGRELRPYQFLIRIFDYTDRLAEFNEDLSELTIWPSTKKETFETKNGVTKSVSIKPFLILKRSSGPLDSNDLKDQPLIAFIANAKKALQKK